MDKFYNKDINEIYNFFGSSTSGLNNKQLKENEKKYGKNEIKEKKQKSIFKVFF